MKQPQSKTRKPQAAAQRTPAGKPLAAELQDSEQDYRNLVETSHDLIWSVDDQGRWTFVNAAVRRIYGYEPAEMLGRRFTDFQTPEQAKKDLEAFARIKAGTPHFNYETVHLRKDGTPVWLNFNAVVRRDEQGRVLGTTGTAQDITERKQAEGALRSLVLGTATAGAKFFDCLVRELAAALQVKFAFVGRLLPGKPDRVRTLAVWAVDRPGENFDYDLAGTPCENVVGKEICHYATGVVEQFPEDKMLAAMRVQSYLGVPLFAADGRALGLLAVLHDRALPSLQLSTDLMRIFANRAAAELLQQEAEATLRHSEGRLRRILESDMLGLLFWNTAGVITEANDAFLRIVGYTQADVRDGLVRWRDMTPPEYRELDERALREVAETGACTPIEKEYIRKDGSRVPILIGGAGLPGQSGEGVAFVLDMTESKQSEQARERGLALVQATLESTADGILVVNALGKIEMFNRVFARMWRLSEEVLASRDDARAIEAVLAQLSKPQQFIDKIHYIYTHPEEESFDTLEFKDGRVFERHSRPQMVSGQAVGRVWSFRDITERKRAERALRDSEGKFHAVFAQSPLAIVLTTLPEGRVADANEAAERLLGHKLADARGKTTVELLLWVDLNDRDRYLQLLQQGEAVNGFAARMRRNDGAEIDVLYHGRVIRFGGQSYVLNSVLDITARRQSEQQLRLVSAALEAAANAIFITDRDGVIQWINPAFTIFSGYTADEAVGRKPSLLKAAVHDADFFRRIWQTILAGRVWRGQITNRRKDGRHYVSEQTISPVKDARGEITHFVSVQQDITDRQSLEEQLRHAQKMEAVGQLAGGVAHDFNNLLTAIIGHLGLLRDNPAVSPEIVGSLGEISAAANRAANLTGQLLTFSRRQVLSVSSLDINEVVTNLTKMLRRILGEDVAMQLDFAPEQLTIQGDAGQLEQVLVNLAVNSRDAMPDGGTLRITTRSEKRLPPVGEAQNDAIVPGEFVRLSVGDTGSGMTPEVKARIFEPFFTTKDVGKGTGLGLAMVFGIVQQHHGWIEVDSEPGRGTTFRIYLPRQAEASTIAADVPTAAPRGGGGEMVLLVEDEPLVQEMGKLALTHFGYRVLTASNGREALKLWHTHQGEIALLLTDMIMPEGISGQQLARQLQAEKPALKVVYSSGYNAEIAGKKLNLRDGVNYLAKPYELECLLRTVRAALDSRHSRPPF